MYLLKSLDFHFYISTDNYIRKFSQLNLLNYSENFMYDASSCIPMYCISTHILNISSRANHWSPIHQYILAIAAVNSISSANIHDVWAYFYFAISYKLLKQWMLNKFSLSLIVKQVVIESVKQVVIDCDCQTGCHWVCYCSLNSTESLMEKWHCKPVWSI